MREVEKPLVGEADHNKARYENRSLWYTKNSFLVELSKSLNKTAAIPCNLEADKGMETIMPETLYFLNCYCQSVHTCPPPFEVTTRHHGNDTVYEGTLTIFSTSKKTHGENTGRKRCNNITMIWQNTTDIPSNFAKESLQASTLSLERAKVWEQNQKSGKVVQVRLLTKKEDKHLVQSYR